MFTTSRVDLLGKFIHNVLGEAALVYNKPYSFSQYIMDEFAQQINARGRDRFLLYPRFLMMVIQHLLPNLPPLQNLVQVSSIDKMTYTDCVNHNARRPVEERPRETVLFGHLVNPNYIALANENFLDDEFFAQQQQQQQPKPQQQQR